MSAANADYVDKIRRFLTHDLWRTDLSTRSITASAVRFLQFWVMVGGVNQFRCEQGWSH